MERLNEIKDRLAKAAPGPWTYDEMAYIWQEEHLKEGYMIAMIRGNGYLKKIMPENQANQQMNDNANLIANAPEDIKWLVAELAQSKYDYEALEDHKEQMKQQIEQLIRFKEYWSELYGTGLEIANWHQNGELEPFDSFYESAVECMEVYND